MKRHTQIFHFAGGLFGDHRIGEWGDRTGPGRWALLCS